MSIRFCEFCSTVHPEVTTHCPDCGALLVQTVSEEAFNDPNTPWPFTPIDGLCLEIQGKPRYVSFSGTHSIFHLWTELHNAYEEGCLYCRTKRDDEMELASTFGIASIPTVVLVKDGKVAATSVGYRPKADLLKMLDF